MDSLEVLVPFSCSIPPALPKANCPTAVVPEPVILSTVKAVPAVTLPVGNFSV